MAVGASRTNELTAFSSHSPPPASNVSRTCSANVSAGSNTAAKPPCAHAVDPASSVSLVTINTSRTGRAASAAAKPAAPEPSTTTSVSLVHDTDGALNAAGNETSRVVTTIAIPLSLTVFLSQSCAQPRVALCRQCLVAQLLRLYLCAMPPTISLEYSSSCTCTLLHD